MEKQIVSKVLKQCKWYEKIIVELFKNIIVKVYNIARINVFNNIID